MTFYFHSWSDLIDFQVPLSCICPCRIIVLAAQLLDECFTMNLNKFNSFVGKIFEFFIHIVCSFLAFLEMKKKWNKKCDVIIFQRHSSIFNSRPIAPSWMSSQILFSMYRKMIRLWVELHHLVVLALVHNCPAANKQDERKIKWFLKRYLRFYLNQAKYADENQCNFRHDQIYYPLD